jgi:hypothetical protein
MGSLFNHFGKLALARPTFVSVAIITLTLVMRWKLRGHVWFWITMAFFAAIHLALILFVPWTTKWIPALVIIPIGTADLYAMLWVISVVAESEGEPIAPPGKHPRAKKLRQDREV